MTPAPAAAGKIAADRAVLVVVDVQERLAKAMSDRERLEANVARLAKGARVLDVPVLATLQYPKGLGPLVPRVAEAIGEGVTPVEKTAFSCLGESAFAKEWDIARSHVVLAGIEAHVCVLQTGLDFLARGASVFVVADAVDSRDPANRDAGLARLTGAGAVAVTTEMVLFELLGDASHARFTDVQALVK